MRIVEIYFPSVLIQTTRRFASDKKKRAPAGNLALKLAALFLATQAYAGTSYAQNLSPQQLQLAQQVSAEQIDKLVFRSHIQPTWLGADGRYFWYFRDDAKAASYILVDTQTRQKQRLFDPKLLATALQKASGKPVDAQQLKLAGLRVVKERTQLEFNFEGKAWQYEIASQNLRLREVKPNSNPKNSREVISPDAQWLVSMRNYNVYLKNLQTGIEQQLTSDGTALQAYAQAIMNPNLLIQGKHQSADEIADFVWSPDSKKFATIRLDLRQAATLTLVQAAPADGSKRARAYTYPYALTGDSATATASLMIYDLAQARFTAAQMPAQAVLYYGSPNFQWDSGSQFVYSLQPERNYQALHWYRVNASDGVAKPLISETTAPFADYYGHRHEYDGKRKQVYWTSDVTGWKHFYRYDAETGQLLNPLTQGNWRVGEILFVDSEKQQVVVEGYGREAGRDPYLRHIYRVSSDGKQLQLLTPEALNHDVSLAANGSYLVDNMSSANQPTQTVLRDGQTGEILMQLESADASALTALGWRVPEPFKTIASDGKTELYGLLYHPFQTQAGGGKARTTKPAPAAYPMLEHIYTGPHTSYVPKSFHRALRSTLLPFTALNIAGVYIDAPGTSRRSREFLNTAYKNLGDNGYAEHEAALRELAKRYPQYDSQRVGIFGFSAGGYDTVRAMLTRPDFYKVGWAASGNHDHRADKAVWNEQWMGYPSSELYQQASNLTLAGQLKGKLMIAHGELDTNVHPMASMQLADALIKANKDFDLLWMPNADHYLDDIPYYNRRRWEFFYRHLQRHSGASQSR